MYPKYPNLESLESKVAQLLVRDPDVQGLLGHQKPQFTVEVFPQTWGSTVTGFDVTPNNEPTIGGCAMTTEYTSVFHEHVTNTYAVCFGEHPCYMALNPSTLFFTDLGDRNMASLSRAKKEY